MRGWLGRLDLSRRPGWIAAGRCRVGGRMARCAPRAGPLPRGPLLMRGPPLPRGPPPMTGVLDLSGAARAGRVVLLPGVRVVGSKRAVLSGWMR